MDMINVSVYREKISRSFENQIMATYADIPTAVSFANVVGLILSKTYLYSLYSTMRECPFLDAHLP